MRTTHDCFQNNLMSWTQVFPVLTDELVSEYQQRATADERREAKEWFRVERVINAQDRPHVVPFALYNRPLRVVDADFVELTHGNIRKITKSAGVRVPAFHKHQVAPVLRGTRELRKKRPDVVVRVYLANDLAFLADELVAAGCEVCVMAHSSLRHSPGALWRFLPLAEKGRVVTVSDSIYSPRVVADITRTDAMLRAGLGFWRVPYAAGVDVHGEFAYRPISRSQFGAIGGYPVQRLAEVLVWHTRKGSIPITCNPPGGCGTPKISGAKWPDFGFDEWFLLSAIYPRVARKGVLTLADAAATSLVLPLDVEYTTWANPRSEVVYFGEASKGCCPAPAKKGKQKRVKIPPKEIPYWNQWEKLPLLMNALGLCGSAVKLGARTGEQSAEFLAAWRGKRWSVVERWKPRRATSWVDSENFQKQSAWDVARKAFDKALRGEKRVTVIETTEAVAAKQFAKESLDLVWLNEDRSFQGTLTAIERWWPLLRDGGIMAGVGSRDGFHGSPYGAHSWHGVHSALNEWRRRTGIGSFKTVDGKDGWLMFKTKLPRPEDVLVITGATAEVAYADISTKNHRAYCAKWGHRYHCFGEEGFDRSRSLQWSKIGMMRKALRKSKWVLWIDCDAVFNDWSVPISRLCLSPFSMICSIWQFGGIVRPSSGVFVMQNTAIARELLDEVWAFPRSRHSGAHEEDAMWSVMKRNARFRKALLAVDWPELNSSATFGGNIADPILHFLQLKDTRTPILKDVCKMIEERNRRDRGDR